MKTFYFNDIESEEVIDNNLLSKNWEKCNIVLKNSHYQVDYIFYNNIHYFKTIKDYNCNKFNKLFNMEYIVYKNYFNNKIIKLIKFN